MRTKIKILSVVLILQLGLIIYLIFKPETNAISVDAKALLLNLAAADIDELQIFGTEEEENKKNKVLIVRYNNGKWTMPDHYNFDAQQEKVDHILSKLLQLKRGWAVATTKAAADRFKVTADKFERKLVFYSKGRTLQTLILGTSPRFKKTHVRLATENNIYEAGLGLHEVSVAPQDWLNTSYLHLDQTEINKIELPNLKLNRDATVGNDFVVTPEIAKEKLDRAKLETLLYRVTHVNLQDIITDKEQKAIAKLAPKFKYAIQLKTGNSIEYKIYEQPDKEYYVLSKSDDKLLFKVDKHNIDQIASIKANELVLDSAKPSDNKPVASEVKPTASSEITTDKNNLNLSAKVDNTEEDLASEEIALEEGLLEQEENL